MANTTLNTSISDTDTTVVFDSVNGFPIANESQAFEIVVTQSGNSEIIRVIDTAYPSTSVTVLRGFRGTTAQSFTSGAIIRLKGNAFSVDEQKINKGEGSGGAVDSVNGQTGVVVLDADDIDDTTTTNKFVTATDITHLGNLSGTNSGDQTSIVGIAGTKAQFDTACTDGNFLYVGDVTQYTDEMAQDTVATLIQNGTGITWTYNDGSNTLTPTVTITQYTDELAQDAVGAMIDSSLTYVDGTPLLQRAALTGDVTASAGSNSTTIANDAVTYAKIQNVSATDKLLGRSTTGSGDVEEITCTSAGRALIDDADAAAQRTTLGLGTLATQSGTFSGTSSNTNTGDQNIFQTISVSGQSDVVADSTTDTLTLVAGTNITLTTNASTNTITIDAAAGSGLTQPQVMARLSIGF